MQSQLFCSLYIPINLIQRNGNFSVFVIFINFSAYMLKTFVAFLFVLDFIAASSCSVPYWSSCVGSQRTLFCFNLFENVT